MFGTPSVVPIIATGALSYFDPSSLGELRGVGVHSLIVAYDRVLPRIRDDDNPADFV